MVKAANSNFGPTFIFPDRDVAVIRGDNSGESGNSTDQ